MAAKKPKTLAERQAEARRRRGLPATGRRITNRNYSSEPNAPGASDAMAGDGDDRARGHYIVDANARIATRDGRSLSAREMEGQQGVTRNLDGSYTVDANTHLRNQDGSTESVQNSQWAKYQGTGPVGGSPSPATAGTSTPTPADAPDENAVDDEDDERAQAQSGATIRNLLNQYGLDELVPQVDRWVRDGLTWAEIEVQLRDPSTKAGKVVDRIFPEIRLTREAGRPPVSIDQIQTFRRDVPAMMRQAGMPEGLYDTHEDLQNLIVNGVAPTEVAARIREWEDFGTQIAAGAGGELDLFERAYGVKPTAIQLAALVLNPEKALPALRREFSAVRLDVAAGRAGFGDLSRTEAERLADVGVDPQRAAEGFGVLSDSKELFDALPGFEQSEDQIGRDEQLAGVFENNANARQKITNRAERRKAQFGSGGAFSSDRDGFSGVGRAR